jgi:hypothetical protein
MRTRAGKASVVTIGVVAAIAALGALGACSDDGGGSAEEDLLDNPSVEDCQGALRTFFDRVEIPDGFDASDGVDEEELAAAEAATDEAAEGLFDPDDDDHPCNVAMDTLSEDETNEFIDSLDPEKVAFFGAMAQSSFEPVGDDL